MLARTRALLGDGPGRRYVLLEGHGWPVLEDEGFDLVWAFDVLVHLDLEDLWTCLQETRRVLRPGGTAVLHVADLTTDDGFAQFRREASHGRDGFRLFSRLRFLDDAMARRLLREAGLRVVDGNLRDGRRELLRRDLLYVVERAEGA
jgi:predicted SAM-dependent methyltransferase